MNPTNPKTTGCHYPKKKDNLKNLKDSAVEQEDWIPSEAF
jgi:hypothetical protein